MDTHKYLWVTAALLLLWFVVYGFVVTHHELALDSPTWTEAFTKAGFAPFDLSKISHDEDTWYYNGVDTCVAYGDWQQKCPRNTSFCGGGDVIGDASQQSASVKEAVSQGGKHKGCPLL